MMMKKEVSSLKRLVVIFLNDEMERTGEQVISVPVTPVTGDDIIIDDEPYRLINREIDADNKTVRYLLKKVI